MSRATEATKLAVGPVTDPVRVMLVDDSVVVRGLIGRWIDEDPDLAVISSHRNGKLAVDDVERSDPDVVVLDIEMPVMDGLTALPQLLKKKPGLVVIMASTLTRRNAEISVRALSLGAQDYVAKPETNSGVTTSLDFRRELIEKIKQLGKRGRVKSGTARAASLRQRPTPVREQSPAVDRKAQPPVARVSQKPATPSGEFTLRPYSKQPARVLAIGTSTGGPQALASLLGQLRPVLNRVPVLVTQHMPPTFTAILAEHLSKSAGCPAREGSDGEVLRPGNIYVAPGGKHMRIEKNGVETVIRLDDGPMINFCKPAVDPLFESVAKVYGPGTLALVLTGMGHDGAQGAGVITRSGGSVIAQDEESSVVWGMPGAAAQAGVCSEILPLDGIGTKVRRILEGGRA